MVSVKKLQRYGNQWTAEVVTWDGEKIDFRTNEKGNGIWDGGRQLDGTSQFSLSGCSHGAARARIVKRFSM